MYSDVLCVCFQMVCVYIWISYVCIKLCCVNVYIAVLFVHSFVLYMLLYMCICVCVHSAVLIDCAFIYGVYALRYVPVSSDASTGQNLLPTL